MLDCPVDLGGVAAPTNGFASHVDPIKLALEQEQKVRNAGINRYGERDENARHRRSSDPRWPRVMRRRP
jgi:ferritin